MLILATFPQNCGEGPGCIHWGKQALSVFSLRVLDVALVTATPRGCVQSAQVFRPEEQGRIPAWHSKTLSTFPGLSVASPCVRHWNGNIDNSARGKVLMFGSFVANRVSKVLEIPQVAFPRDSEMPTLSSAGMSGVGLWRYRGLRCATACLDTCGQHRSLQGLADWQELMAGCREHRAGGTWVSLPCAGNPSLFVQRQAPLGLAFDPFLMNSF